MPIVVQKFGGSSVGTPERIKRVAQRISETAAAGNNVAVIVSAMGDSTDDLLELAAQICDNPPAREMDMLLSTGEQVSISLLAMALHQLGSPAISLTGAQAGFVTDGVYSKARIISLKAERVKEEFKRGNIVIVAGFQGVNEKGEITTLGRGGSDTSAVALAVALEADVCEIYTDVDGVYTTDPRVEDKARKLPEISYDVMLELAAMGAVVLQPRSVELAKQYGIKLHVRSSFNHNEGTIVKEDAVMINTLEKEMVVCGIAQDSNVLKVTLFGVPDKPGTAAYVFSALGEAGVNVDMIIQSETGKDNQDISFTCGRQDRAKVEALAEVFKKELPVENYSIVDRFAKVSVVGAGMITRSGVAATMFRTLSDHNINIDMISTSEIKISCVVEESQVNEAVRALHTAFELDA